MALRHVRAVADGGYGSRRLVVIAVFDVVGFSRLVEADDETTLDAWRALRREIDPILANGGGRIFKSLGDGLMVEFSSPVDATRTALKVQAAAAAFGGAPADRRKATDKGGLELRCAIHMGDVMVEGDDLIGDGINVAARLQEHAPPGGVLVSAAVLDLIGGRIDAPVDDLGTLHLKNIRRPVQAYLVGPGERAASTPAIESFDRRRPSIAVLPFAERGPEGDSLFGEGLTEDMISALSCLPELMVISRSSVLRYRKATPDPRQVQRELGVRYMLAGTVRHAGTKVRVSAELADCTTGATIWSDRFDGAANDLFELQDEMSARVVATITPHVQEAELRRALRKRPESLDAYEHVLRGLDLYYRFDDDQFEKALPFFERAIELDASYATAHALAADWHSVRIGQGRSADAIREFQQVDQLSRTALTLDRFDPRALSLSAHVRAFSFREYDQALELFDRALTATPSSSVAWVRSSPTFSYMGETREARRRADIGLRLSPHDAHVFYTYGIIALSCYAAADYEGTIQWARKSAAINPRFTANQRFLTAGLAAAGRLDEAKQAAGDLLKVDPRFSVRAFVKDHAFRDPARRELFGAHLKQAGLPD